MLRISFEQKSIRIAKATDNGSGSRGSHNKDARLRTMKVRNPCTLVKGLRLEQNCAETSRPTQVLA